MKKVLYLILLFSIFIFPNSVLSVSGCCSSHGGVDCTKIQSNGNVVCVDGTTGSSCSYSSMAKCEGYSPVLNYGEEATTSSSTSKEETVSSVKVIQEVNKVVYGCTDTTAKNYDSKATDDDGNCIYYINGCTDQEALNYDETAEIDDGSCIEKVYGCTDISATNYNEVANVEDNSCEYSYSISQEALSVDDSSYFEVEEDPTPIEWIIGLLILFGLPTLIIIKIIKFIKKKKI